MATEPTAPGGLRRLSQRHARGEIGTSGYREARRAYIDRVVAGQQRADEDAPSPAQEDATGSFMATQPLPGRYHSVLRSPIERRLTRPVVLALAVIVSVALLVLAA